VRYTECSTKDRASIPISSVLVWQRHAVCAIANLMEMMELHSQFLEAKGVPPLVALATVEDPHTKGEVRLTTVVTGGV
jgi:hypothetical protein